MTIGFLPTSNASDHRDRLRALIIEAFAPLSFDTVIQRLDQASIANAKVNDMQASGSTHN